MSDDLHDASERFMKRLEEHEKKYRDDPEYKKWWDSLSNSQSKLIAGAVGR